MSNNSVNYIVDSKGNNYGKKKAYIDKKKIVSKAIVDNTNKNITLIDRKGNKYYFGFEILDKAINQLSKKPTKKNVIGIQAKNEKELNYLALDLLHAVEIIDDDLFCELQNKHAKKLKVEE